MKKSKNIPSEEIQRLLKSVYDDCKQEDTAVRERQIRQWRRLKLLWEGFQRVWFSEVAHDWRVWDEISDQDSDQAYYDKPINIFKAYLESIIAALSVTVPPIKCYPDDADNTLDLDTAKAGDKIAQLIYRHNDVVLLWIHALFINVTEGMVAFYSYPAEDKAYGTYEEKTYRDDEEDHELTTCSQCGHTISDNIVPPLDPNQQQPGQPPLLPLDNQNENPQDEKLVKNEFDEFMPDDDDAELHAALYSGQDICPACMAMMDPEIKREKFIVTRLVGVTQQPKSRICIEAYGGLYVKISNFAKNQKGCPYLIFSKECDYSMTIEKYDHLHGNPELVKSLKGGNNPGGYDWYDQWGRLSPQYQGEYPLNVVTVNHAWIRPGKFNILKDKSDVDKLKKLYPDGVKVTFINEQFACAENECLDDCWTLIENPLSDFVHFDPAGQGLVSVQEITNDLISLILQTIEHGIGQTFADPAVLDFNAYTQTEVIPGGVFPAKPKSGKSLNEAFYELRTATLSTEVMPFGSQIQSLGQLVSGALPSLFGGNIEGSETASQYSMSRSQALQRLQNTWKLFTTAWKNVFGKVIPIYIKGVKETNEDEREVQLTDDGNFINIFIHQADLEGKIGKVELEANENLPMTWSQQKDLMMKLLESTNPKIMEMINAPENVALIHDMLGLVDFYLPGEDDIIKQYDEIKLLLASEPIQQPPDPMMVQQAMMSGMPPPPMEEVSSIPIDPLYDNSKIEFEIVRKWAISPVGRYAKINNEPGYRNVLLHGKEHYMQIQQAQMAEQQQQAMLGSSGAAPNAKPNPKRQEAPIIGESNVATQ